MKTFYQSRFRRFGESLSTCLLLLLPIISSAQYPPNAWQITDESTAVGSSLSYSTNLTAAQQFAATNGSGSFHFTVAGRFVTDFGGSKAIVMIYGLGSKRYLAWFELDAHNDLTVELEGNSTNVLTANGTGSAVYHTHEILYTNGVASYIFDGQVVTTNWIASDTAYSAGAVTWGSASSGGEGQMNFQSVSFEVAGLGVVAAYDAGSSNNPATPPDPVTKGWIMTPSAFASNTIALPVVADSIGSLPNAWQIVDNTVSASLSYYTNLPATARQAATNQAGGFTFTVDARFAENYGSSAPVMAMIYGDGKTRWEILWSRGGTLLQSELVNTISPLSTEVQVVPNDPNGTNFYHTFQLVFDPTNRMAAFTVDGAVQLPAWPGAADTTWPAGKLAWGSVSSSGKGIMNFHAVSFVASNEVAAVYDAGMAGDPAAARDPVSMGWTLSSATPPPGTDTNAISPDMTLLPTASTHAASQFTSVSAQLNGQANASGSSATAWFDWGTTLAYGSNTPSQSIGAGLSQISVSNTLSGIILGTNYHFRLVASNAFGTVAGYDRSFDLRSFRPTVGTADADMLTNHSARLRGIVNPHGLPTMAWFEWGTDTNYGNATAMQDLGVSSANITAVISNLSDGVVYYYRAMASNAVAVVAGGETTFSLPFLSPLVITDVPQIVDGSVACGDYDGDGRLDFLITGAGYDTNVNYLGPISQIRHNDGAGVFSEVTAAVAPGLPGVSYSAVAWCDYDNDGWLDFLITGSTTNGSVSQLWRNTGTGFTNVPIAGLPQVDSGSVAWGDYNNDGRPDFLITGTYYDSTAHYISQLWRNTGGGFANVPIPGLAGVIYGSVAWADYDRDRQLDFLITGGAYDTNGDSIGPISQIWHNDGNGSFSNVTAASAPDLPPFIAGASTWGDYDNDGWPDFLITGDQFDTNQSFITSLSQIWHNNGNSTFSNVTSDLALDLPGVEFGSVAWGDLNNDGWLDFLIAGYYPDASISFCLLARQTDGGFILDPIELTEIGPGSLLASGDYDNNGRLDFLMTGDPQNGTPCHLWRNTMAISNAPPAAPAGLSAAFVGDSVALKWNPPPDDFTPMTGLNYNLRIGTTPGGSDILAPMSLANGLRLLPTWGNVPSGTNALLLLPSGTNYWSVQAIDTAFAGGPFAPESSLVVPNPTLIIVSSNLSAIITWQPDSPGMFLQETLSLAPATWSNSPSGPTNPVVVPVTNSTRFFRLIKIPPS